MLQHRPSPPYHDPYARPPPRPPDVTDPLDSQKDLLDNDLDRNVDIEENSPFQEGIISEIYERLDTSYIQEPQELKDLIDTTKLIQKYLPKQTDIDKILDIIKRKVLKGTHLPLTTKEIQAGYLSSPYFKDLYLFLSQNELPSKRASVKKVKTLEESFVLIDSLIFKLVMMPDKESAVLAIPKICIDKIIALYHTSLFTGHQGVVKTYLTMRGKFFIPHLMHYLKSFIKGCHIYQLSRFVLLDSLIFKLVTTTDKEAAILAIPEVCVDKIITLYHTSLFTGYQGVVKTYLTMKDKFFFPNLMHYLRSFIKGCHMCQLSRSDKLPTRQLQP